MAEERAKRKLSAILSADVKGYSRLMGEDELATIETLKNYREIMGDLINKFQGRVVDSPGDNILAEFSSVVDALECSVEIQKELRQKNEQLPENRRMEFRIGVNLGDVVEDGERIYGDGVNIAARVESLAEGGGICISGTAFDQVGKKLSLGYEYLGEQTVKNIEKPVRAYRVLMGPEYAGKVIGEERPRPSKWPRTAIAAFIILVIVAGALTIWNFYFRAPRTEPASVDRMYFPLPEKPSIAVLPFDNMSGDPKDEYLSDGITENIITALSKVPEMFVIARNSTFTYKGTPVKVQKVAEDLGVRYVLEGSVRRAGERLRIAAQLIDALTGKHLWAEQYDRVLKDLFTLQDEITMKIITALRVKLTEGVQALMLAKGTDNLKAYLNHLEARALFLHLNKADNALARQMAEETIRMEPNFPGAYSLLAQITLMDAYFGISPRENLKRAFALAQKAIALDDTSARGYRVLGFIYSWKRQHEKAIAALEKALTIEPGAAYGYFGLGRSLDYAGRHEEGLEMLKKAIRMDPLPPSPYYMHLGFAYCNLGRYEEAIPALKRAIHIEPSNAGAHRGLAASYSLAGREEDARAAAKELLRVHPNFSLKRYEKISPYNKVLRERLIEALSKAGLPERPPLALPDKPSIAVLPFTNMSEDPKQEYFSDGITEEIITALSKTPKLFVIARNSSFTYQGKAVNVQRVGRELGVRYVLEGSVRKVGNRVRITAQLVDTTTRHHLWAERYDRDLKDIFALQDEITKQILTAIELKLTEGEHARLWIKKPKSLEAYLKYLQAREYSLRYNKDDNILARQLGEEAIALDPEYAAAYRVVAGTHLYDARFGWSDSPARSMKRVIKLAQKALSIDDSLPAAHCLLGAVYLMKRDFEKALAEAELEIALKPNSPGVFVGLGAILACVERTEEAVQWVEKAIRLNPLPPPNYLTIQGLAYYLSRRYEETLSVYNKLVDANPNHIVAQIYLASCYSLLGREEEARRAATEVLRIQPKLSLEAFAKTIPFKNPADGELLIDSLRKAGLK